MTSTILQFGSETAEDLHASSSHRASTQVTTTGDLLEKLHERNARSYKLLRTICGLLGVYIGQPGDQILIDVIDDRRKGFRRFLERRRYAENSVRTYVYHLSVLLKKARQAGWKPDRSAPDAWKSLLVLAAERKLIDIARHFSRNTKTPGEVTIDDVDRWAESRIQDGTSFTTVAEKKNRFWRLLKDTGWATLTPLSVLRHRGYGVPLDQLPQELRHEIDVALKWKQAEIARDRPKRGKIRAISARNLRLIICQLAGFAINVCGIIPTSLPELIKRETVERFVEWLFNDRHVKGQSIQTRLGLLSAVMNYYPAYALLDFSWLKTIIDGIPPEDESERKERKAKKFVEYQLLETIPERIRALRTAFEKGRKRDIKRVARLAQEELMLRWLLILPWRQRNLRECRIGGPMPNLFKGKVSPFSELDKPSWVLEEEARNQNTEFWQIRFAPKETKTGIAVNVLLPRQLIGPLEQYLAEYRPLLLAGRNTESLFVNGIGRPLSDESVEKIVGRWTAKFSGVRTTPHLFRDAVAFKWLKDHPKDFLTLSKILWHKNVQTTINIYGSRFNESSGVCAMEAWLDERASDVPARQTIMSGESRTPLCPDACCRQID